MNENHAMELLNKYKNRMFGWNIKYPLPEWVYVWLEYLENIEKVQEKYKDYKFPERQLDGNPEENELLKLSDIYYKKVQNLLLKYKKLHPEEFEDKK